MQRYLIYDAQVITEHNLWDRGWLLVENRRIAQMGSGTCPKALIQSVTAAELINGTSKTVLPGFIDVHVHGAVGRDTMDATPEALQAMARFYASHGVTGFLATTMTAERVATQRALENAAACKGQVDHGATILGVHLEGPYVNVAMKGAQPEHLIRRADPDEYNEWLSVNVIKQVTVAPEFVENHHFIEECVSRGIVVSIGHTQAKYAEVQTAIKLGARQATHTFNAMIGLHHREPGTVGSVLIADELCCELITDTIHVHPAVIKLAVRAAGVDRIILITDAMAGAGMPEGVYDLGGNDVTVRDGKATLADGTLAGSVLTMDKALQNTLAATGIPLATLWPTTSANAARQLGLDNRKGKLAEGFDADIVLLDAQYQVQLTMAEGRIVYQADRAS